MENGRRLSRGFPYVSRQQIPQLPNTIRQSCFHRGRDAQRLVNSAEVVVGEVEAVRGPKILPLLRERVRQPREAAHLQTDGEILALDVAGANLRRIGIAHDWDLLRVRDIGRAVPALAFRVLRVDLDQLCEVATVAESGRNRAHVGLESIGADLEALTAGSVAQALNKGVRGGLAATAQGEIENQFGVAFDGNEAVGVTDAVIVRFKRGLVAFPLLNEGPDFVALNILHRDVDDQLSQSPNHRMTCVKCCGLLKGPRAAESTFRRN